MCCRLCLAIIATASLSAQGLEYVKANYTKYEYKIAMRDGKRLFTSVYVPKDQTKKYPILLSRTPYTVAPYGEDLYKSDVGPSPLIGKEGYIVVYQDVRGRNMSEGEFVNMTPHVAAKSGNKEIDESTDTYDTIDWLVKNLPNNNGRVGTWGISYPGFYTAAGMIDAHPAHKAASPQAPIVDWFAGDDFHRNGALYLPHAFNFLANFGRARPQPVPGSTYRFEHGMTDGYGFFNRMGPLFNADEKWLKREVPFWSEMMKHDTYDEFWKKRNLRPHLKSIKPAVMTVGGWFDAENIYGALQVYDTVERTSPDASNKIVMGPWYHGGWSRDPGDKLGDVHFNAKTSEYYREKIELPFFNKVLKEKGDKDLPEATMFETGTNVWRELDHWPPKSAQSKPLYFQPGGKLAFTPPPAADPFDEYPSDPSKPVPYTAVVSIRMTREYMSEDQRFAASRPDVLVYQTEPLEDAITFAGPLKPSLFVSTTGTDSDWIVKLIDVYPDGLDIEYDRDGNRKQTGPPFLGAYQQLVRGEVFRGKFRDGLDNPKPFEPGKPAKVEYGMNDVFHTFRRGHRIMVQVQSSWFPLVDRNPQKFMNINEAKESDFQKTIQRVYHTPQMPSNLGVLITP